jgi:transposase
MTNDLLRLKMWLKENFITQVAMESTGVYWKPVFNILEDSFDVILVNARYVKNVPGIKTDVQASERLCKLLRSGLDEGQLHPSYRGQGTQGLDQVQEETHPECNL